MVRKMMSTLIGEVEACNQQVVEVLENMVFLSNAANFVSYFKASMHYPLAQAANMVTNFMGTSFLLTIFGGFISDSFIPKFWAFILFGTIELLGLATLTVQAQYARFQPAMGRTPSTSEAAMLYGGLYTMATGVGGIKAALPAHGANQLDHTNKRLMNAFFNWFFFSVAMGGILASTIMVWVEDNKGWKWSFTIGIIIFSAALCIFVAGLPFYRHTRPTGSSLSRIFKVVASTARNWKTPSQEMITENGFGGRSSNKFRFLNRAIMDDTISPGQVEETKTFLGLLPIFLSTIMMNCCLAQVQTFSVQQGVLMNKRLFNHFEIPTPSLVAPPLIIMLSSIPLYEHLAGKLSKSKKFSEKNPFEPLRRIGFGLVLASVAMAVAAIVEAKRREAAVYDKVELRVYWLVFQFLLLVFSDFLTLGGMLEFFYSEAPDSMRSMCTALAWCSTSMGYFLSSVLVWVTNSVTGSLGKAWLGGITLNENRLDLFYTLLCVLNFVNFLNYVYWAKRF
ncbi:protein NRT1/ PTR FAMILY 4.2-like isoform X2 [Macadamia integrifolia]|uniref:protein NRT1/ PTR FAMILY 4.2-like isoform X2 n=1 Tax=Macadamia integrifolia TaxID=60698 RepID=UPI001C4FF8EA|nr:protein NRT1/ PTR FAMILY 4.2-like isoform X2 [Macadamia integrifolia]